MAKKRSKKSEEVTAGKKSNTDIVVAIITSRTTIIVAIISLIGTIAAAIITSGSKNSNLSPTANPVSTSVATTSVTSSGFNCVYPPRYGFECGQSGWDKTSYFENKAIQAVTTTQFVGKDQAPSQVLALTVDFTGTTASRKKLNRESGEAQVDLNGFPPTGYAAQSVDLHGLAVVAWIWAPKGSMGDPSHKNGVQLFVKDINNKNCYGVWNNISQEEIWFRVSWQENNAVLCDSGFDSSKPSLLGVKIAIGKDSIWTTNDLLTFYVDDVDWQTLQ